MGGGTKAMLTKLDTAFEEKKYKWSLKLCDALLNINAEKSKATVRLYNFLFILPYCSCIEVHSVKISEDYICSLYISGNENSLSKKTC